MNGRLKYIFFIFFCLEAGAWTGVDSTVASYTSNSSLSECVFIIYVKAIDYFGAWSGPASYIIELDRIPLSPANVAGNTPANDATSTLIWTVLSDAVGSRCWFVLMINIIVLENS